MARKRIKFRRHPLSLAKQNWDILTCYPNFKARGNRSRYVWTGVLQPTPLSVKYKVSIEYDLHHTPKVYVLSPALKSYDKNIKVPHTYRPNQPCIFYPRSQEWTNEKLISRTVIPWLSLWLFYYELWLVSGEWLGGGIHPPLGENKQLE